MSLVRIVSMLGDVQSVTDIEEKYIEYSPYLSSALSFVMLNQDGNVEVNDARLIAVIKINGHDPTVISNYLEFLVGNPFKMEKIDEEFFDFMGHLNEYQYPRYIWGLKLRNKWIRDNFYKYDLCERDDGLYGLVEIPIVNNSLNALMTGADAINVVIPPTLTIAGGYALWMAGYARTYSDIDIFPLSKKDGVDFALRYDLSIISSATASANAFTDPANGPNVNCALQLIKREYACLSEIVHGFDIDCTGFIYVPGSDGNSGKLYATELAYHSAREKEIWFDPEFTEERYYWRLSKYIGKGFTLRLPLISRDEINPLRLEYFAGRLRYVEEERNNNVNMLLLSAPLDSQIRYLSYRDAHLPYYIPRYLPQNLGTLLLLMSFFGFNNSIDAEYTNMYMSSIIGQRRESTRAFDPYAHEEEPMDKYALEDWVERKKTILRQPYVSNLNIKSPVELLGVYKQSEMYIVNDPDIPTSRDKMTSRVLLSDYQEEPLGEVFVCESPRRDDIVPLSTLPLFPMTYEHVAPAFPDRESFVRYISSIPEEEIQTPEIEELDISEDDIFQF